MIEKKGQCQGDDSKDWSTGIACRGPRVILSTTGSTWLPPIPLNVEQKKMIEGAFLESAVSLEELSRPCFLVDILDQRSSNFLNGASSLSLRPLEGELL